MNNPFDYKNEMESLRFTEGQKEMLARRIAGAAEERAPRRQPRMRTALAVAMAAVVLTVAAGATGLLRDVGEAFSGIFGGVCETEIVDRIGQPVGASKSDGGYTVTAEAVLGDRYHLAIVFTLSRDDGKELSFEANENGYLPVMFHESYIALGDFGGSHSSSYFKDPVPGDNAVQYVELISTDRPIAGHTVHAHFKDFRRWGADGETLGAGTWDLKFRLNYEDLSVTVPSGEEFTHNGVPFTLDTVTVSPLGLRVEYTAEERVPWEKEDGPTVGFSAGETEDDRMTGERNEELETYLSGIETLLKFKDGSTLDCTNIGGRISDDTRCVKNGIFPEIIDLKTVESVVFGGVEVPLG